MKLKKVLSLVLGGVMALSMLTACGSSSGTETPIDNVDTSDVKTGIVSLVQAGMTENKVGMHQANITLTGNEDKDLALIRELLAGRDKFDDIFVEGVTANFNTGEFDTETVKYLLNSISRGSTYLFVYKTGALTEQDIADDMLDILKARWDIHENEPNWNTYAIGKISAFEFSNLTNNLTYGDTYVDINGTTYDISELTLVVVTASSSTTLA